jgi:N-acetyltransferase 10
VNACLRSIDRPALPPLPLPPDSLPRLILLACVCVLQASLQRGVQAAGDLIPWTVAQQFQDHKFAALSGARIVRIAVHPEATNMGYGRWVVWAVGGWVTG